MSSPIARMPSRRSSIASAWRSSAPDVSPCFEPVARLAHVALGLAQRLARRLAGGAGQPLLELLHQLAQRLLALGERLVVAGLALAVGPLAVLRLAALAALSAGPPVAELALELLEALVGEALLLAERVGEALHRLLALGALALLALPLPDHHLHVLEHLLEHLEERLRLLLAPLLAELLDAVHQLLDLVLGHHLVGRDLGLLLLAALDGVARHLLHVVARRLAELVHQLGDLLVAGVVLERLLEPLLGPRQPLGGVAEVAVLDLHRRAATAPRRPRRAPRRPCPRPSPRRAAASPSARRDRPRGCRRPRRGWLLTAFSTRVTRAAFAADHSRSRRCSTSASASGS